MFTKKLLMKLLFFIPCIAAADSNPNFHEMTCSKMWSDPTAPSKIWPSGVRFHMVQVEPNHFSYEYSILNSDGTVFKTLSQKTSDCYTVMNDVRFPPQLAVLFCDASPAEGFGLYIIVDQHPLPTETHPYAVVIVNMRTPNPCEIDPRICGSLFLGGYFDYGECTWKE